MGAWSAHIPQDRPYLASLLSAEKGLILLRGLIREEHSAGVPVSQWNRSHTQYEQDCVGRESLGNENSPLSPSAFQRSLLHNTWQFDSLGSEEKLLFFVSVNFRVDRATLKITVKVNKTFLNSFPPAEDSALPLWKVVIQPRRRHLQRRQPALVLKSHLLRETRMRSVLSEVPLPTSQERKFST